MIKKYGYIALLPAILWASCCLSTQELTPEERVINLLQEMDQRVHGQEMDQRRAIDLRNALINNYQANKRMGNGAAVELMREIEKVLGAYYAYAKALQKKQTDQPTKVFLELIGKSKELLTIFLVGNSDPKDQQKPYRFVLSKIDDPAIADPLAIISQDTKDEIRRNYQFIKSLKSMAPHLVKRLEPLGVALG